jgi:membrane-associated HD superfamily phosphohydrolase
VNVSTISDAQNRSLSEPRQLRDWARTSGYIASIVVDMILLYVVQHLLDWNVPWITAAWSDVLWAVNLSLTVSIVANALLLGYDRLWFYRVVEAISTALALLAAYWIYLVFPFDFGAQWTPLAYMVMSAVLLGLGIAVVVLSVLAIVELARAGWREVSQVER